MDKIFDVLIIPLFFTVIGAALAYRFSLVSYAKNNENKKISDIKYDIIKSLENNSNNSIMKINNLIKKTQDSNCTPNDRMSIISAFNDLNRESFLLEFVEPNSFFKIQKHSDIITCYYIDSSYLKPDKKSVINSWEEIIKILYL